MIKGAEQPAMQAIRTKAVARMAVMAIARSLLCGVGGVGVSFIWASWRI